MTNLGFCREYFTRNIKKYARYDFLSKHLDQKRLHLFKGITSTDCQRWIRIPIDYLSPREALAVGIYLKTMPVSKKDSEKCLKYLEYSIPDINAKNSEEIKYYALMALGIFYFDEAIKGPLERQKKILKICNHYFEECGNSEIHDELLSLHQMIVEVANEDKEAAVKFLVRASKINPHPQILFQVLSSIYLELGMERVSHYYFSRSEDTQRAA
jgi:hypothetical protein